VSHPEQLAFFNAVAAENKHLVSGGRVLEIGSYDVNGSVRRIFGNAGTYVGVDLHEGPGVDRIGFGHEVADPDGSFDAAISGECFEHDPHWRETLANMVRLVRPGGLVAFSCASRGRPEHGTSRTDRTLSPGTQSVGLDYYRNVSQADLATLPLTEWFGEHSSWYLSTNFDLYFVGVRAGSAEEMARIPEAAAIEGIGELMSGLHKAARLPLRALASSSLSEERYQNVIRPYWQTLLRLLEGKVSRSPRTQSGG
jgi:SAM-dependent methyltransferase